MTRIALVTTTIQTPNAVRRFLDEARKLKDLELRAFIVGDKKTPDLASWCTESGSEVKWIPASQQDRWKISKTLRWNCIQRRNLGFLEAFAEGPFDFYLSVDDDNLPVEGYFKEFFSLLEKPLSKQVKASGDWFNYFQDAEVKPSIALFPRGFPIAERGKALWTESPCELDPKKVELFQGLSLGDPDTDAFTHIVAHPRVTRVTHSSIVSDSALSPINSQNTFLREKILPLFLMFDQIGRFDDIVAGLLVQVYVYANAGWIHFGAPMTKQERGQRDWFKDFGLEVEGHLSLESILKYLRSVSAKGISPQSWMRKLFCETPNAPEFFLRHRPLVEAWLQDFDSCKSR